MFAGRLVWKGLAAVVVLLLLGSLSVFSFATWHGNFIQAEFHLTFTNENGQPIEGIQMRVENTQGGHSYYYPVTDYSPERMPVSDKNGLLVFHHVYSYAPEFGGTCGRLFFLIPIGERSAPQYNCIFLLDQKEVARIKYNQLDNEIVKNDNSATSISVRWHWPQNASQGFPWHLRLDPIPEEEDIEFIVSQKHIIVPLSAR